MGYDGATVIGLKNISAWIYPFFIIAGITLGPIGLFLESPVLAGIGNAMFIAGIFTPMLILKQVTPKDSFVGGVFFATVIYFWLDGSVNGVALLTALPLLIASIGLTRFSGTRLTTESH